MPKKSPFLQQFFLVLATTLSCLHVFRHLSLMTLKTGCLATTRLRTKTTNMIRRSKTRKLKKSPTSKTWFQGTYFAATNELAKYHHFPLFSWRNAQATCQISPVDLQSVLNIGHFMFYNNFDMYRCLISRLYIKQVLLPKSPNLHRTFGVRGHQTPIIGPDAQPKIFFY